MTPIIEVKGLSKKYQIGEQQPYLTLRDSLASLVRNPFKKIKEGLNKDEFWALKDINFTVEPGEVVGIIGRNGAGKSTLLKILSRITPPTSGEVILRGRVGSLLEVGTGFQQELTGRENIYLNGAILGMTQVEIKRKFDEIVAFAEVEKFIDTPVKHYSSGMYMRLAFSIAAHLDPEILIVDEVLAVGDAEFQKKCLGKMDEVSKKQGKTVIFVSHNIEAIRELCSKAILLQNGSLISTDETDIVLKMYAKTFIINNDSKLNEIVLTESNVLDKKTDFIFKKIYILNSKNAKTRKLLLDESFSINIEGILGKNAEDMDIGVGIINEDQVTLFNSFSSDSISVRTYKKGSIKITAKFNNYFPPGRYFVGLKANGHNISAWVKEAISFEVVDIKIDDNSGLRSNFAGLIRYPVLWEK